MTTIAKLAKGNPVKSGTARGVVVGFERDFVLIRWGERDEPARYTDDGLRERGIVKASLFDDNAEDTVP